MGVASSLPLPACVHLLAVAATTERNLMMERESSNSRLWPLSWCSIRLRANVNEASDKSGCIQCVKEYINYWYIV